MRSWEQARVENAHAAAICDADWKNDTEFATCGADGLVKLWDLSRRDPVHTFRGHKGEVTHVKWDSAGTILASSGSDHSAKASSVASTPRSCGSLLKANNVDIVLKSIQRQSPASSGCQAGPTVRTLSFRYCWQRAVEMRRSNCGMWRAVCQRRRFGSITTR